MNMIIVLVLSIAATAASMSPVTEQKCYSNFDFQERLLEKMVTLDRNMKHLNEQFNQKIEVIAELSAMAKTDNSKTESDIRNITDQLQQEHEKKIIELEATEAKMKLDTEKKLAELDESMQMAETKLERMSLNLHAVANWTLEKIKGENSKPNVAFLARTVSDTSPGTNTVLVFRTTLTNTDNVYSTSTGYFTAPVDGTYWFSAQIAGRVKKHVNFRIYVNDTMMSDTTGYDANTNYSCTSSNIVAVLRKGDHVYVKTGGNTSQETVIGQGMYSWAMFMGALVN